MNMHKHVQVKSFNRTNKPKENVNEWENYWKLIGYDGQIIADEQVYQKLVKTTDTDNLRVLVKFFCNVKELGLACHNEDHNSDWVNSLWFLVDDLEFMEK